MFLLLITLSCSLKKANSPYTTLKRTHTHRSHSRKKFINTQPKKKYKFNAPSILQRSSMKNPGFIKSNDFILFSTLLDKPSSFDLTPEQARSLLFIAALKKQPLSKSSEDK